MQTCLTAPACQRTPSLIAARPPPARLARPTTAAPIGGAARTFPATARPIKMAALGAWKERERVEC